MDLSGLCLHTPQHAGWVVVMKDLPLCSMEQCNLFEPRVPDPSNEDNTTSADTFKMFREVVRVKQVNPEKTIAVITAAWLGSLCLVYVGSTPLKILRCWRTELL